MLQANPGRLSVPLQDLHLSRCRATLAQIAEKPLRVHPDKLQPRRRAPRAVNSGPGLVSPDKNGDPLLELNHQDSGILTDMARHSAQPSLSGAHRVRLGEEGTKRVVGSLAADNEQRVVQIAACNHARTDAQKVLDADEVAAEVNKAAAPAPKLRSAGYQRWVVS